MDNIVHMIGIVALLAWLVTGIPWFAFSVLSWAAFIYLDLSA